MIRIYFDNCCLNRPFDDPSQDRIRLEVEAIAVIVRKVKHGSWVWVTSAILDDEREKCPDDTKKRLVLNLFTLPFERVELSWDDVERAMRLRGLGFKDYDSLHLAAAERGRCDAFLTTDDRLIARARKLGNEIKVRVSNPIDWLLESFS